MIKITTVSVPWSVGVTTQCSTEQYNVKYLVCFSSGIMIKTSAPNQLFSGLDLTVLSSGMVRIGVHSKRRLSL